MVLRLSPRSGGLLALFAAVNTGDLISTWVDLHAGLREGNPFMSMLLTQHGFGALIMYKVLVVALVSVITLLLWPERPRLVSYTLLACNLLVCCAIAVNVVQFPLA
jgi:hypothetical protein